MTLRELVLELRKDIKDLNTSFAEHNLRPHPDAVSRKEMYATLLGLVTITLGGLRLFL